MILGLSFRRGEDFYANDQRFIVSEILSTVEFCVVRESDGQVFRIAGGQSAELIPSCWAGVGERSRSKLARISFEAPKDILISEGEKYRQSGGHKR